jgi:hypothetical protein
MNIYSAYGMTIRSDLNLDDYLPRVENQTPAHCILSAAAREGMPVPNPEDVADFVMHDQPAKFWLDYGSDEDAAISSWGLSVNSGIWFWGDSTSGEIHYHVDDQSLPDGLSEKLPFWLIHAVFPIQAALMLEGLWLHAATVEVDGRALVITGPSRAGKSTLAKALVGQGGKLVSDDKLRVLVAADGVFAVPSHPRNRASRAFQELGEVQPFTSSVLPVACILRLQRSASVETPTIDDLQGIEAFTESHANTLFDFLPDANRDLKMHALLVNSVRMGRLTIPDDPSRLDASAAAILSHQWVRNPA